MPSLPASLLSSSPPTPKIDDPEELVEVDGDEMDDAEIAAVPEDGIGAPEDKIPDVTQMPVEQIVPAVLEQSSDSAAAARLAALRAPKNAWLASGTAALSRFLTPNHIVNAHICSQASTRSDIVDLMHLRS